MQPDVYCLESVQTRTDGQTAAGTWPFQAGGVLAGREDQTQDVKATHGKSAPF